MISAYHVLIGAGQIAEFLGVSRSRVYTLVRNNGLPTFKLGNVICARRVTLDRWIEEQEARAVGKVV